MISRFGIDVFAESPGALSTATSSISLTDYAYPWKIEFVNYKSYYVGHSGCPISDGGFSLTTFGSGNADIEMTRMDIPLKSQDRVNIYYKGEKKWSGFISKEPDKRGGKLDLSPQIEKLQNAIYNGSLNGTWTTSISAILADSNDVTAISYNAYKIALSSTDTVSISYDYTDVKSIFDAMIDQFDNKFYGVDALNEMFISSFSTTITKTIYSHDIPWYADVNVKIDDTKVKMTRAQVFQRSTSTGSNVRRGQVGYSSPYPPFTEIEQRTGIKESKITVPASLSASPSTQNAALDYAYKQIQAEAVVNTNVSIKNLDYSKYPVTIGEYIRVYQPEAIAWNVILDCNNITGWNNATLSTSIFKAGTGSIQCSTAGTWYEWERQKIRTPIKKLGFFLYSNNYGNLLSVKLDGELGTGSTYSFGAYSMSTAVNSSAHNISYFAPNVWQWIEIPTTYNDFSAITFQALSTDTILIDEISIYGFTRNYYDVNVKEIKFNFNSDTVDVTAGYFDAGINDDFFALERKVKALEETLQS